MSRGPRALPRPTASRPPNFRARSFFSSRTVSLQPVLLSRACARALGERLGIERRCRDDCRCARARFADSATVWPRAAARFASRRSRCRDLQASTLSSGRVALRLEGLEAVIREHDPLDDRRRRIAATSSSATRQPRAARSCAGTSPPHRRRCGTVRVDLRPLAEADATAAFAHADGAAHRAGRRIPPSLTAGAIFAAILLRAKADGDRPRPASPASSRKSIFTTARPARRRCPPRRAVP